VIDVAKWADILLRAEADHVAIPPITEAEPGLTVDEGYAIQAEVVTRKVAAGERVIGAKLGLTSVAKQQQMGVDEPVYGVLFSGGIQAIETPVAVDGFIHPRVEPEIVLKLGAGLAGPGVTAADVLEATVAVVCGLEIIDSRFTDFRFTAADVVADNTSAAGTLVGPVCVAPDGLDLSLVGVLFEHDGALVSTATGAAALGHPAEAVARLANFLGARGSRLEAGWLVYTGGLTNAVPLTTGTHVRATFAHLGSVGVRAV
jgi:2-oxo-3-hexenedioate decarboxylase